MEENQTDTYLSIECIKTAKPGLARSVNGRALEIEINEIARRRTTLFGWQDERTLAVLAPFILGDAGGRETIR